MRAFTPDGPTQALTPFTVDAGHFQYESDLINYTHTNYVGAGTISYLTADPTLKLGLTNWVDFEVVLNGYLNSSTHDNLTGALVSNGHGFGDTILKTKFNVLGNDGGAVALALIPSASRRNQQQQQQQQEGGPQELDISRNSSGAFERVRAEMIRLGTLEY